MKIERREFVTSVLAGGLAIPAVAAQNHKHGRLSGPLASAKVSFGAWPASGDAPLDRFETPDAPGAPNVHQLIPNTVTIKTGGTVDFIIAGFHVVAIYGPGTKPGDIDETNLEPLPGAPPDLPPAIADPNNRVYRGLNPIGPPQDRVEVVQFHRRGTYLVICAFLPHFEDGMWGFVRVLP
jgi:plastocyanin